MHFIVIARWTFDLIYAIPHDVYFSVWCVFNLHNFRILKYKLISSVTPQYPTKKFVIYDESCCTGSLLGFWTEIQNFRSISSSIRKIWKFSYFSFLTMPLYFRTNCFKMFINKGLEPEKLKPIGIFTIFQLVLDF